MSRRAGAGRRRRQGPSYDHRSLTHRHVPPERRRWPIDDRPIEDRPAARAVRRHQGTRWSRVGFHPRPTFGRQRARLSAGGWHMMLPRGRPQTVFRVCSEDEYEQGDNRHGEEPRTSARLPRRSLAVGMIALASALLTGLVTHSTHPHLGDAGPRTVSRGDPRGTTHEPVSASSEMRPPDTRRIPGPRAEARHGPGGPSVPGGVRAWEGATRGCGAGSVRCAPALRQRSAPTESVGVTGAREAIRRPDVSTGAVQSSASRLTREFGFER